MLFRFTDTWACGNMLLIDDDGSEFQIDNADPDGVPNHENAWISYPVNEAGYMKKQQ